MSVAVVAAFSVLMREIAAPFEQASSHEMQDASVHPLHRKVAGAAMATDLIANAVPVGINAIRPYVQFFQSGQLVPLAITSTTRMPLMPDMPTVVELAQPRHVHENFLGLTGPCKLPPVKPAGVRL